MENLRDSDDLRKVETQPPLSSEDDRKRRDAFRERILEEWGSKLDNMDQRVVGEGRESVIGDFKYLDVVRTRIQEAKLLHEQLKRSGTDREALSKDFDKKMEELKLDFERAQNII